MRRANGKVIKPNKRQTVIDIAKDAIQRDKPRTIGYEAVQHLWFRQPRNLPVFNFAMIRAMLIDPEVRLNLSKRAGPIMKAEFGYKQGEQWTEGVLCERPEVGEYIYRQIKRIWNLHLPCVLRSQVWGWSAGEVTLRLSQHNIVEIDKLIPRHAQDCRVLLSEQEPWGVQISRVKHSDVGKVNLPFPLSWFHSYGAEDGDYYGVSALLGAYSPWASKWLNGGALDVRQLFMHKDAYGGADLGFPEGQTEVSPGNWVDNVHIARQIVEQLESGGVIVRPSKRDEHGGEQWPLQRATITGNPQHILQYPKDLDAEIRAGLEVPEEDGDAWASKRVTMASFYASLDSWIVQIISDLKAQIIDNLVLLNFGAIPEYDIQHKPLAEQAMEQQSNAGPGAQQGDATAQGFDPSQQQQPPAVPGQAAPAVPPTPPQPPAPSMPQTMSVVKRAEGGGEFAYEQERLEVIADILADVFGADTINLYDTLPESEDDRLELISDILATVATGTETIDLRLDLIAAILATI